jgi:hypothetical protein
VKFVGGQIEGKVYDGSETRCSAGGKSSVGVRGSWGSCHSAGGDHDRYSAPLWSVPPSVTLTLRY